MRTFVLGTADASAWRDAAAAAGATDVYFLPEYHAAYEHVGLGRARAFVAEEDGWTFLHATVVRPITDGDAFDAESVYGYSGPMATTTEQSFLERAWAAYAEWVEAEGLVAEFIRFNPFLETQHFAPPDAHVVRERDLVVLPLGGGDLWAAYEPRHRTSVRRAERAGLRSVELSSRDPAFRRLYAQTMERVAAHAYYRFGDDYFDALAEGLGDRLRVFGAQDDGALVAAGLFLVGEDTLHYHLAGSERVPGAANLVLHAAAAWGAENGLHRLNLGGGLTAAADDALLRFKSAVSAARRAFYTGRIVHDQATYDALCDEWLRRVSPGQRPAHFLLYRLPVGRDVA